MNILEIQNLRKQYKRTEVIKGVNFTIQAGECVALLGPNGAGKTTILKMLIDMVKPSGGSILFEGKKHEGMRDHIGYLPQHPTFYAWMTGKELLSFMGGLSGIEEDVLRVRIAELLKLVGLEQAGDKRIGTYSGGMKQRLGIAQAIIHEPKLLIMDEPVSALDPLGRRDMLDLLKVIKQKTTVLFSTHILHDAEELCDKICILHKGELLTNDPIQHLLRNEQQPIFVVQAPGIEEWTQKLDNHEIIESIELTSQSVRIRVKDIDRGREWLVSRIHSDKLAVQKFEFIQESLEDIFLRLVKEA
ncbi:ABC transporter ATP-binding protein [Bacillus horti]|uniref:ABC-2 type transport system ATP-binding protein n=1 Tax=Caldalkalibacillus horti TaxID=77523 RepID=A0ABT9VYC6_9BACI|nr:ABC transporter ATP-binding protein [Bacillus horti]MDQ0165615.1 ABC-2 type transport system ATP-binding protein [Bacillus horti]